MTATAARPSHVRNPRALFIGGAWVSPSSTSTFDVVDSATEEVFLTVAEAQPADVVRAVAAARAAFDTGPWPPKGARSLEAGEHRFSPCSAHHVFGENSNSLGLLPIRRS
mgnify:CR=1 FL=1